MKPNRKRLKTRFAARHARSVRLGIRQLVDVDEILDRWFGLQSPIDRSDMNHPYDLPGWMGRDWARMNIPIRNTERLNEALGRIYADAFILGRDITAYEIARAIGLRKAAPSKRDLQRALRINWNNWTPGNRAAAALLDPPNGLQRLLQRRGVKIRGMSRTTLDRIGTGLAEGLRQGLTRQEASRLINGILDDSERSLMIAGTEMAYATVQASKDLYRESGVEMVEWLVADPCDDCQENYDQSPIPIGEEWRNGDPPVHPNCMCDIAPYVVDTVSWAEVYGEEAE
jgi:hypothetical protein